MRAHIVRILEIGGIAAILTAFVGIWWEAPAGSFDPFCTYTTQYEVAASLSVGPETLHSVIRAQNRRSRRWVERIFNGGCKPSSNNAHAFVARDGRVFLIPMQLCPLAEEVLRDIEQVDVLRVCKGRWPNRTAGFVVMTADKPTQWELFDPFGNGAATLASMHAVPYRWGSPKDDVEEKAPNLVKTDFDGSRNWYDSPNRVVRRSSDIVYRAQKDEPGIALGRTPR